MYEFWFGKEVDFCEYIDDPSVYGDTEDEKNDGLMEIYGYSFKVIINSYSDDFGWFVVEPVDRFDLMFEMLQKHRNNFPPVAETGVLPDNCFVASADELSTKEAGRLTS